MLTQIKPKTVAINDADIPVIRHVFNKVTLSHSVSRKKRTYHFIKGPIPYDWMLKAANLPGKVLAVALSLWYLKGLKCTNTFSVNSKAVDLSGCSRQAYARGLKSLELAGLLKLDQRPGRRAVVTLTKTEDDTLDA